MRPFASLADAPARIPAPVRGALWMIVSTVFFAMMMATVRRASFDLHAFEVAFFRSLFGIIFLLPWVARAGLTGLRTRRLGLHALRNLGSLGALMCFFVALAMIPIADVTALGFTAPLFASIGAVLFLGEAVYLRRVAAVLTGFAGAMIILRPGIQAVSLPALLVLAGSCFVALEGLSTKSLSRTDSPQAIVLYMGLMVTPLILVPAVFVWTLPSLESLGWMAGVGLSATLGHLTLARAFRLADATAIFPFDFIKLLFASLLGYLFFREFLDAWTWIGAVVIFSAVLYTVHGEARMTRRRDG